MENITTGHWIFAGIFAIAFIGILIWSYRKDLVMHRNYYKGASYFLLFFLIAFFLMFIFKRLL
jgi:hypothetical protein